jgi:hypothetical protein
LLRYVGPGGVAQPGRALPSHGRGQGFKSPHLHDHSAVHSHRAVLPPSSDFSLRRRTGGTAAFSAFSASSLSSSARAESVWKEVAVGVQDHLDTSVASEALLNFFGWPRPRSRVLRSVTHVVPTQRNEAGSVYSGVEYLDPGTDVLEVQESADLVEPLSAALKTWLRLALLEERDVVAKRRRLENPEDTVADDLKVLRRWNRSRWGGPPSRDPDGDRAAAVRGRDRPP